MFHKPVRIFTLRQCSDKEKQFKFRNIFSVQQNQSAQSSEFGSSTKYSRLSNKHAGWKFSKKQKTSRM